MSDDQKPRPRRSVHQIGLSNGPTLRTEDLLDVLATLEFDRVVFEDRIRALEHRLSDIERNAK